MKEDFRHGRMEGVSSVTAFQDDFSGRRSSVGSAGRWMGHERARLLGILGFAAMVVASNSPVLGAEHERISVEGIAPANGIGSAEAEAKVFAARHEIATLLSRVPGSAAGREREELITALQAWRDEFAVGLLAVQAAMASETAAEQMALRDLALAVGPAAENSRRGAGPIERPATGGPRAPAPETREAELARVIADHQAATTRLRESAAKEIRSRPAAPAPLSTSGALTPLDRSVPAEVRAWVEANRRRARLEPLAPPREQVPANPRDRSSADPRPPKSQPSHP